MGDKGLRALKAELGGPPAKGLAQLEDTELRDLAAAIREARIRQAQQLAAGGEQALEQIPRLLRAPIRRMFG